MGSPARPQRRPSGCSATEAGQTQGAAGHGMMCAVPYLGGGVGVDQGQFDDAGPTSGHREGPAARRPADFLGGAHERERLRQRDEVARAGRNGEGAVRRSKAKPARAPHPRPAPARRRLLGHPVPRMPRVTCRNGQWSAAVALTVDVACATMQVSAAARTAAKAPLRGQACGITAAGGNSGRVTPHGHYY